MMDLERLLRSGVLVQYKLKNKIAISLHWDLDRLFSVLLDGRDSFMWFKNEGVKQFKLSNEEGIYSMRLNDHLDFMH